MGRSSSAQCARLHLRINTVYYLVLHLIGIELYLALTTAERDRLKQVSYEKQVARGMRRPGDSSYLTANVWGDLPAWEPQMARKESEIPTSDSDV